MQGGSVTRQKPHSYDKHRQTPRPAPPNTVFFLDPFLFAAFLAWMLEGKEGDALEKYVRDDVLFLKEGLQGYHRDGWQLVRERLFWTSLVLWENACVEKETDNKPGHSRVTEQKC